MTSTPPREASFEEALSDLLEAFDSEDACDVELAEIEKRIIAAHALELAAARKDDAIRLNGLPYKNTIPRRVLYDRLRELEQSVPGYTDEVREVVTK